MIHKYFPKKADNFYFSPEIAEAIPAAFRLFYSTHDPESVLPDPKLIGFNLVGFGIEKDGQFTYFGDLLSVEEMDAQLKFDWEDYVMKFQLLKIGDSVYTEGGVYMGLNGGNFGQIFHYINYIEVAQNDEIIKMADSFDELMENAEVYGISLDENDSSIFTKLNTDVLKSLEE